MGGKGGRVFRNMYKGTMDKTKGGQDEGWEVGMTGVGRVVGGKWRQLFLNNSKKVNKNKNYIKINNIIKYKMIFKSSILYIWGKEQSVVATVLGVYSKLVNFLQHHWLLLPWRISKCDNCITELGSQFSPLYFHIDFLSFPKLKSISLCMVLRI